MDDKAPARHPVVAEPGASSLTAEPDRVEVALADLIDAAHELVQVVVLGVQVAPDERVVAARRELADKLWSQLGRRPWRVVGQGARIELGADQARAEEEH